MPQFAANLSMLYTEHAFLDRFKAAADSRFKAVEYLFPYAYDAQTLAALLKQHHLKQVLFNAPPGGGDDASAIDAAWLRGERGTACITGREHDFQAGFALAMRYAKHMSCPNIHVMAGIAPADIEQAKNTYIKNLQWAAKQAAALNICVLIEPINTRDMPGYYLNYQAQAHALLVDIAAPNVRVQMDVYHCQIMEGDIVSKLRQYVATGNVGHIQIAGVPQRHEPDMGELNYAYIFKVLDELSQAGMWQGWVGCEYRPALGTQVGATQAGLNWLTPYL